MEDNKTQNETPGLSKQSKETNDINDSQEKQRKDTNPLNITDDILPTVSSNFNFNSYLTIYINISFINLVFN